MKEPVLKKHRYYIFPLITQLLAKSEPFPSIGYWKFQRNAVEKVLPAITLLFTPTVLSTSVAYFR